jgi:hypothetical protein
MLEWFRGAYRPRLGALAVETPSRDEKNVSRRVSEFALPLVSGWLRAADA